MAGSAAGVDPRTAKRAYFFGCSDQVDKRPIKEILASEQIAARAHVIEEQREENRAQDKEMSDAKTDAIESRKVQGQILRLARSNVMQALAATADIMRTAIAMGERCKEKLQAMLYRDKTREPGSAPCPTCGREPEKFDARAILSILDQMTNVVAKVVSLSQQVTEMERLYLGDPTAIIAIEGVETMTTEEAETRLKIAMQAVQGAIELRRQKELWAVEDEKSQAPTNGKHVH